VAQQAVLVGDPAATIVGLFDELADGVYTLAARLLRDRYLAEDVVQETFLAALRKLDTYRGDGPLAAWIYRIGYRKSIEAHRRRREDPVDPVELAERTRRVVTSAEHEAVRNELTAALDRAIGGLSPPLRAVFVLRDVEGLRTADTAVALEVTESAVKMRLLRARKELRKSLKEYL
jgi:RNA polymerase sigma-70 factor (ECF subfamily)